MARTTITPLSQLGKRAPEAGRIRLGVKSGRAMKSIDTFRFTSPHEDLIRQLAELYGGTCQPWTDERARIQNQFEVITTSSSVPVYLPPDGLSMWYEKWSGGGCERRCDGESCEIVEMHGSEAVPVNNPCICIAKGVRECQPYTRLNVVLPQLRFAGTWRLETKGWNAAHELPGMVDLIQSLHAAGNMVQATLSVEKRSDKAAGRTRHYVVPMLSVDHSPQELQSGMGSVVAIANAPAPPVVRELDAVGPSTIDDIVDGEVVDPLMEAVETIACEFGLDPDDFAAAVYDQTDGDEERIKTMISKVQAGALVPSIITDEGVTWIRK